MILPLNNTAHESDDPEESSPDEADDLRQEVTQLQGVIQGLTSQNESIGGRLHSARQDLADTQGRLIARTAERDAALAREAIWNQTSRDLQVENTQLRTQLATAMALATPNIVATAVGPIAAPIDLPDLPPPNPPADDQDEL